MGKITIAFCLVAVSLLATSPALAWCPHRSRASDGTCPPSSPSAETTVTPRSQPVTKLGTHPSGSPSGEQVFPQGYKGTPSYCSPLDPDGKKVILFWPFRPFCFGPVSRRALSLCHHRE